MIIRTRTRLILQQCGSGRQWTWLAGSAIVLLYHAVWVLISAVGKNNISILYGLSLIARRCQNSEGIPA